MTIILIYIPYPQRPLAKKTAELLIQKKLIACANILTIDSIYRWEGKIADEPEFVLLAKTVPENYDKVKAEVEKTHPYDLPCILKINAEANEKYLNWVKGELKP
jgi:periplasmic divalent cation tolerance protein